MHKLIRTILHACMHGHVPLQIIVDSGNAGHLSSSLTPESSDPKVSGVIIGKLVRSCNLILGAAPKDMAALKSSIVQAVRFSMPLNKRVDVRDLEGELSTLIHLSKLELNAAYPHKLIMACLQP